MADKIKKSDEEWKKILTKEEYRILRKEGTEPAFTGKLLNNKKKGVYVCAGCENPLFSSETKYDSGSGWPSFYVSLSKDNIETRMDRSMFLERNEVHCERCGGHLGHLFDDGPKPTGLRYCIDSAALHFKEETEKGKEKPRQSH